LHAKAGNSRHATRAPPENQKRPDRSGRGVPVRRSDSCGWSSEGAWAARRPGVAHSEARLRRRPTCHSRVRCKVKPEFSTLHRPVFTHHHTRRLARGAQSPGERYRQQSRRIEGLGTSLAKEQVAARDSPSCTGVGVVKLGRGGSAVGVSRPGPISIRAPPPDSGVVPFSSRSRTTPNQSVNDFSGRLGFVAWILETDPGPYVSGTMEANDRTNHAYGISCRTRPILAAGTRSGSTKTGTAWAVSQTDAPNKPGTDFRADGLGQKSGLIWGQSIASPNCSETAR